MRLGLGIVLLLIGAVLAFAVKDNLSGVNLTMVGYIRGSQVFPPVPELAGGNNAGGGGAAPGGGGGAARGGNTSPGGSTIRFGAGKARTGGL